MKKNQIQKELNNTVAFTVSCKQHNIYKRFDVVGMTSKTLVVNEELNKALIEAREEAGRYAQKEAERLYATNKTTGSRSSLTHFKGMILISSVEIKSSVAIDKVSKATQAFNRRLREKQENA